MSWKELGTSSVWIHVGGCTEINWRTLLQYTASHTEFHCKHFYLNITVLQVCWHEEKLLYTDLQVFVEPEEWSLCTALYSSGSSSISVINTDSINVVAVVVVAAAAAVIVVVVVTLQPEVVASVVVVTLLLLATTNASSRSGSHEISFQP